MLIYWGCCFGIFCVLWTVWLVQDTEWENCSTRSRWRWFLCCHQEPHGASALLELCSPHCCHAPSQGCAAQGARGAQIQVCPHGASCMLVSGTHFWREMCCGTDPCVPTPGDSWLSRARGFRGLQSLFFFFSILAFNQSLLLITKVFPIGRNPTPSDTNFCLYVHMYKYINKPIDSVSWELKKIHHKRTFGGCFAFDVKTFGCCSLSKCQGRSWMSHPMSLQVDVPAQGRSRSCCCVFSCHVYPWPAESSPSALSQVCRAAVPALKVLLLWVHSVISFCDHNVFVVGIYSALLCSSCISKSV